MPIIDIPFVGPAYDLESKEASSQKCINWYPETEHDPIKNREIPVALYPTPGLKDFSDVAGTDSVVRGMIEHKDVLYAVVDNKLYSLDSAGTATQRGTLSTSSGRVSLTALTDEIFLVDSVYGYRYVISSTVFSTVSDADFPNGTGFVTSQDGYVITYSPGTPRFYISAINDGSSWDALDFASAEGAPDNLVTAFSNRRELWLFGDVSTEVWINTGNATFPFERDPSRFMQWGIAARHSVCEVDNSIMWLARNKHGQGMVVTTDGVSVQVVSSTPITNAINTYTTIDDAFAYSYNHVGHIFYVLTFPSAGKTWVYDTVSGMWHERASLIGSEQTRHRSNCYAFAFGKHLVGDYTSGAIYELDKNTYTDDGAAIRRVRVTPFLTEKDKRITINNLVISSDRGIGLNSGQGSDPQYMLRYSKDGGHTWSNELWRTPGKIGEYGRRVKWSLLGTGRRWSFELTVTDPVDAVILGATIDGEAGED